ncbi:MAG: tetraacyldisaccharide 4'-kinase [Candidatus Krumholzibacteria bacterium]|nr:tetraacyldisaccharide 4'-kinase [Candidatus Krumholzibacteria bacterium]
MRIIERYPLGLKLFLGKGWYVLLGPIRFFLAVLYGIYLDIKRDGRKREPSASIGNFQVISIGNLEAGGSGKTPVTLAIASYLMKKGKRVAVVTRGYGSAAEKKGMSVAVVPDGEVVHEFDGRWILSTELEKQMEGRKGKVAGIEVTGDEGYIYMSRKIPVVIDPNRSRGIESAGHLFRPDYILLDDAFRHTEVSVDLNILLLDARRPFGNHRLIPAGTLRERPEAAERADVVIFTRSDGRSIPPDARTLTKGKKILFARHEVSGLVDGDGNRVSIESLEGREVILFSGIARPESFERSMTGMGIEPTVSIRFEDHHDYSEADVDVMRGASAGKPAYITTEKDINKVKGFFDDDLLLALRVEAVIPDIESLLG